MGEVCGILTNYESVVHEFRNKGEKSTEGYRRREEYVQFDEADCWKVLKNAWRWCYMWKEFQEYSVLVRGGMEDTVCAWRRGIRLD